MGYYEYDTGYYEPSGADLFFDEMKEKFREYLNDDIKYELDRLVKENRELREKNDKLQDENYKLNSEKNRAEWSKDSIRREIEDEFYNKNVDEIFKDRLENIDVWFADYAHRNGPKCEYCDDNRHRVYKYPDGFELKKACDCSKKIGYYEPNTATFNTLKYCVKPSRYSSERKIYVQGWQLYKPGRTYDDYGYGDFKILHIVDVFDDNTINLHEESSYGERIGFKSKEECQKYCDWLNKGKDDEE